ncbi:MAG: dienelactone hydrolase family protein [Candidatus Competibacteraceae bacterium]|nr:dienelactone hydrolase family protein [Candidatus Competibacteraceae bacterium]
MVTAVLLAGIATAQAEILTREVDYSTDQSDLQGYLAYDDSIEGQRPGVLVVHEWWGLDDYVRERARMLAQLGYTALALDMYGEGSNTGHPQQAAEFSRQVRQNWQQGQARFQAALKVLREHQTVDPERIAAIGYCFGGGVVLQMAREGGEGLDGVVSFHGSLSPMGQPARPGEVQADILVLHGGADDVVGDQQLQQFRQEMEAAGANYQVVVYQGAKHGFTNPEADAKARQYGLPIGYDPQADRQSWERMKGFLERVFEQP